jgi:hypothetical protein
VWREFYNFAIDNFSELFSYITTGNLNIRICRDITGPPKDASGKQDMVWGRVDVNNYHGKKLGVVLKLKRKS